MHAYTAYIIFVTPLTLTLKDFRFIVCLILNYCVLDFLYEAITYVF